MTHIKYLSYAGLDPRSYLSQTGTLTIITLCLDNKTGETGHGQFHALNMQALNRAAEYIQYF